MTPILLLGAGRMGGAMLQGWALAQAFTPQDLIICDPNLNPEAKDAAPGALFNPPLEALSAARAVLMAVKPQYWRAAAETYGPHLHPDALVVSIAAGIRSKDLFDVFARPVARVMPTTAVAICKGAATLYAPDAAARSVAHALFDCVARTVEVQEEDLIDVATAVSGSAPAYLYAFVEALEAAARRAGFSASAAAALARATIAGASALMEQSGADPAELRRQVTSPGGTTEAALKILQGPGGLDSLLDAAVTAALERAQALAG